MPWDRTKCERQYDWMWCPAGAMLEKLVQMELWQIEKGFRTAKDEFGLDHNETRSWHGWHLSSLMEYAPIAGVRAQANAKGYRTITKPDPIVHSGNQVPYRQIDAETNFYRLVRPKGEASPHDLWRTISAIFWHHERRHISSVPM